MTPETVFAKSPKGLEEIETRAHKLGSRLRQVLIRIDGVKTLDELVVEAGDMGETLVGQIEELERAGYLTDTTIQMAEEAVEATALPAVAAPAKPAPAPKPAVADDNDRTVPAARVAPAPAALKPAAVPKASPPPETVEFNSPVKFKLQDLLVEALGFETGSAGQALNRCRNREDLSRWVDLAVAPIEQRAGKARAKAFHKQAKKLVG